MSDQGYWYSEYECVPHPAPYYDEILSLQLSNIIYSFCELKALRFRDNLSFDFVICNVNAK